MKPRAGCVGLLVLALALVAVLVWLGLRACAQPQGVPDPVIPPFPTVPPGP